MKPFTYYLYHKPTGKKYYGVRTASGCSPDDLWSTYFSSSPNVKQLIQEYGLDTFDVEIRKVFDNKREAILWERKVLTRLNASKSDVWLNKHNGGGAGAHADDTRLKIATNHAKYWSGKKRPELSEKFKGHRVTESTREKISKSLKGRPLTDETKNKMKGRIPWNKGKKGLQVAWNKGLKIQKENA